MSTQKHSGTWREEWPPEMKEPVGRSESEGEHRASEKKKDFQ